VDELRAGGDRGAHVRQVCRRAGTDGPPGGSVIYKAVAARPTDLEDAKTLLALYPDIDLARVRARIEELAEAASEPELAKGLEAVLKPVMRARRAVKGTRSPRKRRR